MKSRTFLILICISIALLAWAFSTRDKEGLALFFFGAAILLCTLVVGGLRLARAAWSKRQGHKPEQGQ